MTAPRNASPHARGSRAPLFGWLIALAALAGLAYRELLWWDPARPGLPSTGWFFFGMSDTAPQIVFAIAAFLLYRRRRRLARALGGKGSPLAALPLLAAGSALYLWSHYVGALDLLLVSFIFFSLGGALLVFGRRFAGELALPILILVFALPLPAVLLNQIVYPLQLWGAEFATLLLNGAGFPVVQEGDMVYLAAGSVEIIESCSGLRAMVMLTMLAVGLVCYFPAPPLHLVILVASASVIAWLVNVARIVAQCLFPEPAHSASHAFQGALLFLVGSAILCTADALIRHWLWDGAFSEEDPHPPAGSRESWHPVRVGPATALAVLLGAMLGASLWMPRWQPPEPPERGGVHLPREVGEWEAAGSLKSDRLYLGSVGFRARDYRRYRRGDETISVFLGDDDRSLRSRSLISEKNEVPGAGWQVEVRARVELRPGGPHVASVTARSGPNRILSLLWYEGTESLRMEVLRAWLATDQSFLRRRGEARVVRLTTDLDGSSQGKREAEARLRDFAELLRARL